MPELIEPTERLGVSVLDALLENIEQNLQMATAHTRRAVAMLAGSSATMLERWGKMCRAVVEGKTGEVQAGRDKFLTDVQSLRDRLLRLRHLATSMMNGSSAGDRLLADIATLDALHSRLTAKWQDRESLESLVAEETTPTVGQLEAVARKYADTHPWDADEEPLF